MAGPNFGTGSSREHAVWALMDYGFQAVISPRFADIFRNNSGKMGLVVAAIPEAAVHRLWEAIEEDPNLEIVVDVEHKRVAAPAIGLDVAFDLDDFTQYRLLNGLDDVGLTLRHADAIDSYESTRPTWFPGEGVGSGGGFVDVGDLVGDPHVGELVREVDRLVVRGQVFEEIDDAHHASSSCSRCCRYRRFKVRVPVCSRALRR